MDSEDGANHIIGPSRFHADVIKSINHQSSISSQCSFAVAGVKCVRASDPRKGLACQRRRHRFTLHSHHFGPDQVCSRGLQPAFRCANHCISCLPERGLKPATTYLACRLSRGKNCNAAMYLSAQSTPLYNDKRPGGCAR